MNTREVTKGGGAISDRVPTDHLLLLRQTWDPTSPPHAHASSRSPRVASRTLPRLLLLLLLSLSKIEGILFVIFSVRLHLLAPRTTHLTTHVALLYCKIDPDAQQQVGSLQARWGMRHHEGCLQLAVWPVGCRWQAGCGGCNGWRTTERPYRPFGR